MTFYTLIHGPLSGVIVSARGRILTVGYEACTEEQRRPDLAAAAACYAWNGPPQPGLSGRVRHRNGDESDCSFGNVAWEGLAPGFQYDTLVRHVNGVLHDNRISNLFLNRDQSKPATCWAVAYEAHACERCRKKTPFGHTLPVPDRFLCRKCIAEETSTACETLRVGSREFVAAVRRTVDAVGRMGRVEIRVARGSKNAIVRTMRELRLTRAAVRIVKMNEEEPKASLSVRAKAVLKRDGTLALKGDVPRMARALDSGHMYVTVAPCSQSPSGKPLGRAMFRCEHGHFNEIVGGYHAVDALLCLLEKIM
jgi:hypothetical protein